MIDDLVNDLKPVTPLRPRQAVLGVMLVFLVAIAVVAGVYGLRPDVMAGRPHPMVMMRGGMLLLLGGATLGAAVRSARPSVGGESRGWLGVVAAAMLFPATAATLFLIDGRMPVGEVMSASAPYCLGISGATGLVIGAVLTLWLRQGAPTDLRQTGWLVGIASGSFGTCAYSLHCPDLSLYYVGLWYTLAVGLCALGGRLIVPRLVRW
jgi:hypothetical protein